MTVQIGSEQQASAAAAPAPRLPVTDPAIRRRPRARDPAGAGPGAHRYAHAAKRGGPLNFQAVRPSQLGTVDALLVPLFADTPAPAWLPPTASAAIAQMRISDTDTPWLT